MTSIKDVAREAGVGLATVSRVINNSGPVSDTTRRKVLEVIKRLDYTPNEVARSFKRKSTKLVGLMVPTIQNPFFSDLAYHIEEALYHAGYKMLLCNSKVDRKKEIQYLKMLKENQVEGIITISYHDYYAHKEINLPLVAIDRYISETVPHVASDNYKGGQIAARELILKGCKKLVYLGGAPSYKSSVSYRKTGFVDYAESKGISVIIHEASDDKSDTVLNADGTVNELKLTQQFVSLYDDYDGVFTSSDIYAIALYSELEKAGKRVPEDVKLIGFDGIQPNRTYKPYLSTIVQPVADIGKYSVSILIDVIEGRTVQLDKVFDVTYRSGDTC